MKSKSLEVSDYQALQDEARSLMRTEAEFHGKDVHFDIQHIHRYWEYASVLAALRETGINPPARVLDVGCGNGPLGPWLATLGYSVDEIDPDGGVTGREALRPILKGRDWAFAGVSLFDFKPGGLYDAVCSISVMEHVPVESQPAAWAKLVSLIKPGGLFIVTIDYGFDGAANEHAREAIFTPTALPNLVDSLTGLGIKFDDVDFEFHGEQVFNYTFFRLIGNKL